MTNETHTTLPKLLTVAEAAEYLGRAPQTLNDWRSQRVGPPYVKIQGGIRYSAVKLLAWLEEREQRPTAEAN